jgi:predicted secreted protein
MVHVQYLESLPQRAHVVIGIITPKTGEYETLAEAVKAMRKEAAKRGADAVYIESQSKEGGWRFSVGGWGRGEGGSFSEVTFRAKAIVWK